MAQRAKLWNYKWDVEWHIWLYGGICNASQHVRNLRDCLSGTELRKDSAELTEPNRHPGDRGELRWGRGGSCTAHHRTWDLSRFLPHIPKAHMELSLNGLIWDEVRFSHFPGNVTRSQEKYKVWSVLSISSQSNRVGRKGVMLITALPGPCWRCLL